MSAYTKGPWQVQNTPGDWGLRGSAYIANMGGSDIAIVSYRTPYCMGASEKDKAAYNEAQSNARLIAAAPELLEALKEIAGMESTVCQHCEGGGAFWADGKAHYPSENLPTVRCSSCGGSGHLAVDLEEVQNIANAAIAKAEGK